jgi:hypothetical protein
VLSKVDIDYYYGFNRIMCCNAFCVQNFCLFGNGYFLVKSSQVNDFLALISIALTFDVV